MTELDIYFNENDWVVAESAEDAVKVWNEFVGDDYLESYGDLEDWQKVDRFTMFSITQEETPENTKRDHPEDVTIEKHPDRNLWTLTTTADKWIKKNGRGWLCSLDW